jgi:hypothetical protein
VPKRKLAFLKGTGWRWGDPRYITIATLRKHTIFYFPFPSVWYKLALSNH